MFSKNDFGVDIPLKRISWPYHDMIDIALRIRETYLGIAIGRVDVAIPIQDVLGFHIEVSPDRTKENQQFWENPDSRTKTAAE